MDRELSLNQRCSDNRLYKSFERVVPPRDPEQQKRRRINPGAVPAESLSSHSDQGEPIFLIRNTDNVTANNNMSGTSVDSGLSISTDHMEVVNDDNIFSYYTDSGDMRNVNSDRGATSKILSKVDVTGSMAGNNAHKHVIYSHRGTSISATISYSRVSDSVNGGVTSNIVDLRTSGATTRTNRNMISNVGYNTQYGYPNNTIGSGANIIGPRVTSATANITSDNCCTEVSGSATVANKAATVADTANVHTSITYKHASSTAPSIRNSQLTDRAQVRTVSVAVNTDRVVTSNAATQTDLSHSKRGLSPEEINQIKNIMNTDLNNSINDTINEPLELNVHLGVGNTNNQYYTNSLWTFPDTVLHGRISESSNTSDHLLEAETAIISSEQNSPRHANALVPITINDKAYSPVSDIDSSDEMILDLVVTRNDNTLVIEIDDDENEDDVNNNRVVLDSELLNVAVGFSEQNKMGLSAYTLPVFDGNKHCKCCKLRKSLEELFRIKIHEFFASYRVSQRTVETQTENEVGTTRSLEVFKPYLNPPTLSTDYTNDRNRRFLVDHPTPPWVPLNQMRNSMSQAPMLLPRTTHNTIMTPSVTLSSHDYCYPNATRMAPMRPMYPTQQETSTQNHNNVAHRLRMAQLEKEYLARKNQWNHQQGQHQYPPHFREVDTAAPHYQQPRPYLMQRIQQPFYQAQPTQRPVPSTMQTQPPMQAQFIPSAPEHSDLQPQYAQAFQFVPPPQPMEFPHEHHQRLNEQQLLEEQLMQQLRRPQIHKKFPKSSYRRNRR